MKKPAPIVLKSPEARGRVTIERVVHMLTPMFGGGVHVDELARQVKPHDPVTPLRSASVRGQLRFWWRAVHGCRYAELKEMRSREAELWGSTGSPASVHLRIADSGIGVPRPYEVFEARQNAKKWNPRALQGKEDLAYGAFPLKSKAGHHERLQQGVLHQYSPRKSARLVLEMPQAEEHEVRDAVDAWLAFGGIGGRTRRGFGAVWDGSALDPVGMIVRLCGDAGEPCRGPSLLGAHVALQEKTHASAIDALQSGLASLRSFRQRAPLARNKGKSKPGRSRWPEADQVRRITGRHASEHKPTEGGVEGFPRAAFGLPIIFQFMTKGDPADATLKPMGRDRLASPILLRPFVAGSGKGDSVPPGERTFGCMALLLADPSRSSMEIGLSCCADPVRHRLEGTEAKQIPPLAGNPNVLDAFLRHFEGKSS